MTWIVGLVAIHYTTSKSPEAAMIALPLTYVLIGRIRSTSGARREWLAAALMGFWLAFVFVGPFISMTYGQQLYPNGPGVGRGYSSLADRILNMWPEAIALIDWRNPVAWIVGRGLGGIGVPQSIFDPPGNSGDNIAIYLFVSFGLVSIVFAYLIFRGGQRAIASGGRGRRDFALIIAMLGIGSAANVVEAPVPIMVLGLALARYRSRQRTSSEGEPAGRSARVRRSRRRGGGSMPEHGV